MPAAVASVKDTQAAKFGEYYSSDTGCLVHMITLRAYFLLDTYFLAGLRVFVPICFEQNIALS